MAPPKYSFYLIPCLLLFCLYANYEALAAGSNRLQEEPQEWLNHGGDLFNRRYGFNERKISPETAPKLGLKWKFYTGKDVTATPAIWNGTIYFPSWNGNIYAVNEADGSLVWMQNVEQLTGLNATGLVSNVNTSVSRSTPTIADDADLLLIGIYGPAVVLALKRTTGHLLWMTRLDQHPASQIAMSGTYYKGRYYVGVSSAEEGANLSECCYFRGSFAKLNASSGEILWQTYMLPDNNGKLDEYSGAALWGSSPSIDALRNHVYIATGNLYSAPKRIIDCQQAQNNQTQPPESDSDPCVEPDNHSNSILALDLDSGDIRWYRQLGGYDVWIAACVNPSTASTACPPAGANPDSDFGEAPIMLTIQTFNATTQDIVVAVQKSGFAWALNRQNGSLLWSTEAGPGGLFGGGTWGSATDEKRVYTNIVNYDAKNFTLIPSNKTTLGGGWVAMDANNGTILWSTANPNNRTNGPVTVANGVVFGASSNADGSIYAINAKTGEFLWSYETGAPVYGGVSVSRGCIYVGHGYNVSQGVILNMTTGTYLFAFCV